MLKTPDLTFGLLLATIRWPDDDQRRAEVTRRASMEIDWTRFIALARRHRVGPLVLHALASAKVDAPPPLSGQLQEIGGRALFLEMAIAGEVGRLCQSLSDRGINVVVLKGPALSLRAYGQLGLRTYRDVDLLVTEHDMAGARAVLEDAGYDLGEPLAAHDLAAWVAHHKDVVLRHAGTGLLVELHWRLFDNRLLMPMAKLAHPTALGVSPLGQVLVLPAAAELRYLCLHGALHGWSRLRWLADVNAILSHSSPEALLVAIGSERGGVEPAVAQALILCRELLGTSLGPDVERALAKTWRGPALARLAWSEILRSGPNELETVRFGSTVKNLSHYAMFDGARALLEELRFDLTAKPRLDGVKAAAKGRFAGWISRHLGSR